MSSEQVITNKVTLPQEETSEPKLSPVQAKQEDQPSKGTFKSADLEKKIVNLRKKILKHRLKQEGNCWYFGFEELEFDYGESWDNVEYWHIQIKTTGGQCLETFKYVNMEKICSNCKKTTQEMNKAWAEWLKLRRSGEITEMYKEENEPSFLGKMFCWASKRK